MTLERAVEQLVAAVQHAENMRRGSLIDRVLARVRLLKALDRYEGIAGVKRLRVVSAELDPALDATG